MIIHQEIGLMVAYGNLYVSFDKQRVDDYKKLTPQEILSLPPFNEFKEVMCLRYLAKTHQVHGSEGIVLIDELKIPRPFTVCGDYLITNLEYVGLAIATADCLPVMLYDEKERVVAAVHAGWRGVISNVVGNAIGDMKEVFGSLPENIKIFIGPAAGSCCYEVQDDVVKQFENLNLKEKVIFEHDQKKYLDLTLAILLQLEELGVSKERCDTSFNTCTMCSPAYASHRKNGTSMRNLTVISLRER